MKALNVKEIGQLGEKYAARHLKKQGLRPIEKNYRSGKNELDIIAKDKQFIVFVEVKCRTYEGDEVPLDSRPAEAVHAEKRRHTVEAALSYLHEHPTRLCPRFDVVEVYLDRTKKYKPFKIHHIPDAFVASGAKRR